MLNAALEARDGDLLLALLTRCASCSASTCSLGFLLFVVFRVRREVRGVSEVPPRRPDDLIHQNPDG